MITKKKYLLSGLVLFLTATITGCEKPDEAHPSFVESISSINASVDKTTVHYGTSTNLGKGVARTWVEVAGDGTPVSIGINISAKAAKLKELPLEQTMYHLQFPKQASVAPFMGMMFDWNPNGHIPDEIYGKPHFDFHFYMIPEEEHMAIPFGPEHPHENWFEKDYMPATYMSLRFAIPGMGNHWIDKATPELHGAQFTKTLILGAYENKQIFIEPMITLEYLQNLKPFNTVSEEIAQFPKVQKSGYYPRKYTMTYDPTSQEYKIALTELYYRVAE